MENTHKSEHLDKKKILTVALILFVITALHYFTPIRDKQFHDMFRRLYYIPIILGSFWFGIRGGISIPILAGFLFAPHVLFQWREFPTHEIDQYLEILIFMTVGIVTGFAAEKEKSQRIKYQQAAKNLGISYKKLQDQTIELMEKEQQLIRADRLATMGELAAGLTHEIKNPLGSILGAAEIIKDDYLPNEKKHEFLEIMIKEVNRLNKVISNFLSFAKVKVPSFKPSNINDVLNSVKDLVEFRLQKENIRVEIGLDKDLKDMLIDAEQLKQALLNIVLNSVQSMKNGGILKISTQVISSDSSDKGTDKAESSDMDRQRLVEIIISDTGCGIPKENLTHIFNPFFTTREEGTGLGLAITKRIIEDHSGNISVESEEGKGASFRVRVPMNRAQGAEGK
ncbi:MAG: hypothetical protein A3C43_00875 [Candidatus Schekmanbacteria bacterium RIFCSPHIGHO2_02_FULL_38_11]|uniref:histidine kinase n=1 Tax=Candidatus Schekmanbacteria bacterium RIFCSPLOWO2_12_FULL_38_15 TaxID=1817883 RepID=A0A1F7SMY6_9BACT|nr:MAG: hypothetical protein A2043_07920 [Candidatus Schekmanbacteria bacterium GWA2_38_9]OGL50025.1 MAG: hypothetical protein A3C43_00875 [Candidatus Schekmanbacteria bacterium RIFCSPHIGHO2_02_FULL_38_11]OGL51140.1 MAG: hypothetical protein A3H37_08950 [Candidatus Schekmanbacteria bacterium RIFCSPLOWO2_02_FULL_38_14]OGL55140.1 MAG: hypothetical protein A3G31_02775 [Candidatus Schekmanbacteria bacterium RIFCSPLOWO2_12_FULL_38_15]